MDSPPLGRMTPYGLEHVAVLALILVLAVGLVAWARRADPGRVDRSLRIAGWVLLANSIFWTGWGLMPWVWNLHESLPLHFSDALRFLLPIALITRARWAIVLSYFWGLTLNSQSVFTPDLNYFVWIPLEFTQYWVAHMSGLLVPIVLVWGLGHRPTWRGYAMAFAVTLGWAALAFTLNVRLGTNYAYLNRAPAGPSLLDVMGPWPIYLLVEALALATVWALMTWPWTVLDARAHSPREGRGGFVRRRVPGTRQAHARAESSGQQLDLGQTQRPGRRGDHDPVAGAGTR